MKGKRIIFVLVFFMTFYAMGEEASSIEVEIKRAITAFANAVWDNNLSTMTIKVEPILLRSAADDSSTGQRTELSDIIGFYIRQRYAPASGAFHVIEDAEGKSGKITGAYLHRGTFEDVTLQLVSETGSVMLIETFRITDGQLKNAGISALPLPKRAPGAALASLDRTLRDVADSIAEDLRRDARVAVIRIDVGTNDAKGQRLANYITNEFMVCLQNNGRIMAFSRDALDLLFKELDFNTTVYVDQSQAVHIGRMAGAQFIIVGSCMDITFAYKLQLRAINVETSQMASAKSIIIEKDEFVKGITGVE
jgi:hypothetical protein